MKNKKNKYNFIDVEVQKIVPTDGDILIVNVDVGKFNMNTAREIMTVVAKSFKKQGLKCIVFGCRDGVGVVSISTISLKDAITTYIDEDTECLDEKIERD